MTRRVAVACILLAIAAGIAYYSTTSDGLLGRYGVNPPKP